MSARSYLICPTSAQGEKGYEKTRIASEDGSGPKGCPEGKIERRRGHGRGGALSENREAVASSFTAKREEVERAGHARRGIPSRSCAAAAELRTCAWRGGSCCRCPG